MKETIDLVFDGGTLLLTGAPSSATLAPYWRWDSRVNGWRCEAAHYHTARPTLKTMWGDTFHDSIKTPGRVFLAARSNMQSDIIAKWSAKGFKGMVETDNPSTRLKLATSAVSTCNVPTLLITPSIETANRWQDYLTNTLGCKVGSPGPGDGLIHAISTATYRYISTCIDQIGERFGLLVFDCAERLLDRENREIALMSTAPHRLGLCSTAEKSNDATRKLGALVGTLIHRSDKQDDSCMPEITRTGIQLTPSEMSDYTAYAEIIDSYIRQQRRATPRYGRKDFACDPCCSPESRDARLASQLADRTLAFARNKWDLIAKTLSESPGYRHIIHTVSAEAAMEMASQFSIPALLPSTPDCEREAITTLVGEGRLHSLITTLPPNRWPELVMETCISTSPWKYHNIPPSIHHINTIFCRNTPEDISSRDSWRRRAHQF